MFKSISFHLSILAGQDIRQSDLSGPSQKLRWPTWERSYHLHHTHVYCPRDRTYCYSIWRYQVSKTNRIGFPSDNFSWSRNIFFLKDWARAHDREGEASYGLAGQPCHAQKDTRLHGWSRPPPGKRLVPRHIWSNHWKSRPRRLECWMSNKRWVVHQLYF